MWNLLLILPFRARNHHLSPISFPLDSHHHHHQLRSSLLLFLFFGQHHPLISSQAFSNHSSNHFHLPLFSLIVIITTIKAAQSLLDRPTSATALHLFGSAALVFLIFTSPPWTSPIIFNFTCITTSTCSTILLDKIHQRSSCLHRLVLGVSSCSLVEVIVSVSRVPLLLLWWTSGGAPLVSSVLLLGKHNRWGRSIPSNFGLCWLAMN